MRNNLILLIALAFTFGCDAIKEEDGLTDSRDGKKYKTVKIGEQIWMAENLNYAAEGSVCYGNQESNCQKYGRLYTWDNAMKACPSGWHLPEVKEWAKLLRYADGTSPDPDGSLYYTSETAGKFLKAKSGWKDDEGNSVGNGTDAFGFAALPGGEGFDSVYRDCGDEDCEEDPLNGVVRFNRIETFGNWWSVWKADDQYVGDIKSHVTMQSNSEFAVLNDEYEQNNFFSVRCLKD